MKGDRYAQKNQGSIFKEDCFRTGRSFLIENNYGNGAVSIHIVQNWRDILKVKVFSTSGSKSSDVWTKQEFEITKKQLIKFLKKEIKNPFGNKVSVWK